MKEMKETMYIRCVYQALLFKERLISYFLQPASRIHCNIAFGEFVVNFSDSYISSSIDTVVPILVDMLRDIPFLRFDRTLSWDGAAHPLRCLPLMIDLLLNRLGSSRPTRLLYHICSTEGFQRASKLWSSGNISHIQFCIPDD
jgi:hypothetical protein